MPVLDANSPAKFYDSLAVGTPVIVTNRGWTKELVDANNCGWYVSAEDAEVLATQIQTRLAQPKALQTAGEAGKRLAEATFGRQQLSETVQRILEAAAR